MCSARFRTLMGFPPVASIRTPQLHSQVISGCPEVNGCYHGLLGYFGTIETSLFLSLLIVFFETFSSYDREPIFPVKATIVWFDNPRIVLTLL